MKYAILLKKWNKDGAYMEEMILVRDNLPDALTEARKWFVNGWNVTKVTEV